MNSTDRLVKSSVELFSLVWRRKLWIILPTILGIAVGFGSIYLIEPTYQASVLLFVEEQKVPTNFVKSSITSRIDQRVKTLEQQLSSRSNIERLIEEAGLHPELRGQVSMDRLIEMTRRQLWIERQRNQAFRIVFEGSDPNSVAIAANKLAEMFIAENLKLREDQAENTTAFLEAELQSTQEQLEAHEARLAKFRLDNDGMLPSQQEANSRALEQLQTKLQMNRGAIERLELRIAFLQQGQRPESGSLLGEAPPRVDRVQQLTLELQRLQSQYTDQHPDVVRIRKEIEQLREAAAARPATPGEGSLDSVADMTFEMEIDQAESELERLRQEEQRILGDMKVYQRRLEGTAAVEQKLISLTRGYDTMRRSYDSLLAKRTEARLAENLERKQQAEQFMIMEEAEPPRRPYKPNRLLLILAGTGIGLMVGIALAVIREQTDETYQTEDALQASFPGVPFVITVPHLKPVSVTAADDANEDREASTA